MNPFFIWLLKSSVCIAILYLVFKLATSRDKIHIVNRFVLLGILVFSAIIPLTSIPVFQANSAMPKFDAVQEFVATPVAKVIHTNTENFQSAQIAESARINFLHVAYMIVILLLLIHLMFSVFRVMQIIQNAEKRKLSNIVLAIVKDLIQPFTFFNKIILSEKDFTENKDIVVAHEHAHIKQMHAIDLVVCELFTVLHFFNPLMWLLRRDLKLVHEYQADQAVLNKGIDAQTYQLLVLQKSVGERRFAMANHFTQKPILKRIKMMHRKNENRWKGIKLIFFIPIVLLLLQAFARPELFVDKASEIVPLIQQDETAKWLGQWTVSNLDNHSMFEREIHDYSKSSGKVVEVMVFRNSLIFKLDKDNKLFIKSENIQKEQLQGIVKEFLKGKHPTYSEGPEYINKILPLVGETQVSKGKMVIIHDKLSSEEAINSVLRNIGEGYLEVRKEIAQEKFNEDYFSLNSEKKSVIDQIIPIRVSTHTIPPPPPPKFVLKLYNNKVTLWEEEISMDEVSVKAKEFVSKAGKDAFVRVDAEKDISVERINALKEELRKAGVMNVNLREMK